MRVNGIAEAMPTKHSVPDFKPGDMTLSNGFQAGRHQARSLPVLSAGTGRDGLRDSVSELWLEAQAESHGNHARGYPARIGIMVAGLGEELGSHVSQLHTKAKTQTAADAVAGDGLEYLVGSHQAGEDVTKKRIKEGHAGHGRLGEIHGATVVTHSTHQVRPELGEWELKPGVGSNGPHVSITVRRSSAAQDRARHTEAVVEKLRTNAEGAGGVVFGTGGDVPTVVQIIAGSRPGG